MVTETSYLSLTLEEMQALARENAALRCDVERQMAIALEHVNEAERFRKERDEARELLERTEEQLFALASGLEGFKQRAAVIDACEASKVHRT